MSFAFLLFLVPFTLFQLTLSQTATNSEKCFFVYGDWSACSASKQTRTIDCVCGGNVVDVQKCTQSEMLPLEQVCDTPCVFKWSKWSVCTKECGGGNITRIPECFCDGETESVTNNFCNMQQFFGRETCPCNEFTCGDQPALNKLYWISRVDSVDWPIEDHVFNCTRGDDPEDSPKGKTYSEVLTETRPSLHKNYLWYYLAREYVTAQLNIANGVKYPGEALKVIKTVGELLENCAGYSEEDPMLYSLKEKLGRLNNNIGGLSNVDAQTGMMVGGNSVTGMKGGERNSRLTFVLAIAVPVAAVMIIAFALALTIYYVRDKTTVAKEEFESEDDEPLQNSLILSDSKPVDVMPLEEVPAPMTKDDSEEQLL